MNDLLSTTHKTKDMNNTNPTKYRVEFRCSEIESGSCTTSGTRRITLVKNPMRTR